MRFPWYREKVNKDYKKTPKHDIRYNIFQSDELMVCKHILKLSAESQLSYCTPVVTGLFPIYDIYIIITDQKSVSLYSGSSSNVQ